MSDLAPLTLKVGAGIGGLTKGLSEAESKTAAFANKVQKELDNIKPPLPDRLVPDDADLGKSLSGFQQRLGNVFNKKNARKISKKAGAITAAVSTELANGYDSASGAVKGLGSAIGASIVGPLGIAVSLTGLIGAGIVKIFENLSRDKVGEKVKEQLNGILDGTNTVRQAEQNLRRDILRTGLERVASANRSFEGLTRQGGLSASAAAIQNVLNTRAGTNSIQRVVQDIERAQTRLRTLLADPGYQRLVNTLGIESAQSGIHDSTESMRDQLATLNMTADAAARYNAIHQLMRRTTLSEAEASAALSGQLREQAAVRLELVRAQRARALNEEFNTLSDSGANELRTLEARMGLLQQNQLFAQDMIREEIELQQLRARGLSEEQIQTRQVQIEYLQWARMRVAMLERGNAIAEGLRSPFERFERARRELDTLYSNGAITEDTFNRGLAREVENLQRAQSSQAMDHGAGAAMLEGSAAALSTLARFQRQSGEGRRDRQAEIADTLQQARNYLRQVRDEAAETAREVRRLTTPTVARF